MKGVTIPDGRETAAREMTACRGGPYPPGLPSRRGAALALMTALVLGAAGEAAAQGVCAGDLPTVPNSGTRIVCQENNPSASGIRINAENVSLSVTSSVSYFVPAIDARLNSASDVNDVNVRLGRGLVIITGGRQELLHRRLHPERGQRRHQGRHGGRRLDHDDGP